MYSLSTLPTMSPTGIILGHDIQTKKPDSVCLAPNDRMRHLYIIGQNGTGKSTLTLTTLIQDIQA
jgi:hypothetical protein